MRERHIALLLFICMLGIEAVSLARPPQFSSADASGQTVTEKSERMREWEKQQEKERNKRRHEDLKKDTDQLLQLATELKAAVDKSNEQTLSLDVVKKAGEVEKLAKSIQRNMKGD